VLRRAAFFTVDPAAFFAFAGALAEVVPFGLLAAVVLDPARPVVFVASTEPDAAALRGEVSRSGALRAARGDLREVVGVAPLEAVPSAWSAASGAVASGSGAGVGAVSDRSSSDPESERFE
jgi:hypothetical protein